MHASDAEAGLPPEPTTRAITPAPEDYRRRIAFRAALWPLLWIAGCVALAWYVASLGWPPWSGGAH